MLDEGNVLEKYVNMDAENKSHYALTYFFDLLNRSIWRELAYLKLSHKVANLSLGDGSMVYQSRLDITNICGGVIGV